MHCMPQRLTGAAAGAEVPAACCSAAATRVALLRRGLCCVKGAWCRAASCGAQGRTLAAARDKVGRLHRAMVGGLLQVVDWNVLPGLLGKRWRGGMHVLASSCSLYIAVHQEPK